MAWNRRTLKRLREQRNLTQAQVAIRAKTHRITIVRLETGKRGPSLDMLQRLARALRVELTDLLK